MHSTLTPRPSRRTFRESAPRTGPSCVSCGHRACRTRRARRLPMLGGHRSEFAREHLRAAELQALNPHLVLWFGEATQSYWVATASGLTEARTIGDLLPLVDPLPE